uniref:Uncharacterized protein n=1 Tax=Anopheles christyi TaxID=43041 RepID=A0A182KIN6_9DIPT
MSVIESSLPPLNLCARCYGLYFSYFLRHQEAIELAFLSIHSRGLRPWIKVTKGKDENASSSISF